MIKSKRAKIARDRTSELPWREEAGRFFVCFHGPDHTWHEWQKHTSMSEAIKAALAVHTVVAKPGDTLSVVREGGGEYFFGQYE